MVNSDVDVVVLRSRRLVFDTKIKERTSAECTLSRFLSFPDPSSAFSQQMERENILKKTARSQRGQHQLYGGGCGGFVDGSLPPSYDFFFCFFSASDLSVQSLIIGKILLCRNAFEISVLLSSS